MKSTKNLKIQQRTSSASNTGQDLLLYYNLKVLVPELYHKSMATEKYHLLENNYSSYDCMTIPEFLAPAHRVLLTAVNFRYLLMATKKGLRRLTASSPK